MNANMYFLCRHFYRYNQINIIENDINTLNTYDFISFQQKNRNNRENKLFLTRKI